MQPLVEPHRRHLRDTLAATMPPEGADAVLAALPASEADMPATKDFVRAEIRDLRAETTSQIKDLRVEITEKFATADANTKDLRVEMTAGFASTDTKIGDLRNEMSDKIAAASTEMKRWVIATGIGLAGAGITLGGVLLAAINTIPA